MIATLRPLAKLLSSRCWSPQPAIQAYKLKGPTSQRPTFIPAGRNELLVFGLLAQRLQARLLQERRALYGSALFSNIPVAEGQPLLSRPYVEGLTGVNAVIQQHLEVAPVVLSLDIRGFFDEIDHGALLKVIGSQGLLGAEELWMLEQVLDSFAGRCDPPLHRGLPQSYFELSAPFAEVFLHSLDLALTAREDLHYCRYVDDLRLFLKTPGDSGDQVQRQVQALTADVSRILTPLGLGLNLDKQVLYDARTQSPEEIPLIGGPAARRLPSEVLRLAGLAHGHPQAADLQVALRELWDARGRLQPNRPFDKTAARFCLARLAPTAGLVEDVLELLSDQPQQCDAVAWFFQRLPQAQVPWIALRAALSDPFHAPAGLKLIRALASVKTIASGDTSHPACAWLEQLGQHGDAGLRWQIGEFRAHARRRWNEERAPSSAEVSWQNLAPLLAEHLALPRHTFHHVTLDLTGDVACRVQRLICGMNVSHARQSYRYVWSAVQLCDLLPELLGSARDGCWDRATALRAGAYQTRAEWRTAASQAVGDTWELLLERALQQVIWTHGQSGTTPPLVA
ncbi:RNA-directed DNA polymerase (plasmid) [Deinococcus sp. KNUC1210]|uniref:RNA-directed DNA polymerase n=1 Tax=Deinococcus sp. KNUC1210 TaxID=2917691 RepID=UPI001EF13B82|nr:RNA-directed DNA polymerase [Deinococcus sp. KNUC1210]ULH17878.1 RNA-directed DNA polymerase [Deinococcus sp. KNUC1210]